MDLREATYATFENRVGETFRTQVADGESLALELTEASQKTGHGRSDDVFSLVFRGQSETPLSQGMYDLEHPDLGTLPIFLVPIAHARSGFSYEAVFTRIKEGPGEE